MGKLSWVNDLAKGAAKNLDEVAQAAAKQADELRRIRVHHGTPHKFPAERLVEMPDGSRQWLVGGVDQLPDIPEGAVVVKDAPLGRFRLEKMGTGEGNQAYGAGHYLAEREGVATDYRNKLAKNEVLLDGHKVKHDRSALDPQSMGLNALQMEKSPEAAAEALRRAVADESLWQRGSQYDHRERYLEAANWLDHNADRIKVDAGSLYTAEIPDDGAYLLWDKPLSEQPESVRNALRRMNKPTTLQDTLKGMDVKQMFRWAKSFDPNSSWDEAFDFGSDPDEVRSALLEAYDDADMRSYLSGDISDTQKGQSLYLQLAAKNGDVEASKTLKELGIPGIKYLDGSSRSAGEGAYNYVLFDDDLIDIKERGMVDPRLLAPLAAGAAGAGALMAAYDFGTPDYDAKIRDFSNRRAAKSQIWKELKEAGATIASAIPAGLVSDAYRIGGYLSPVTTLDETEQGAESVQNALMYTPEGDNRYLNEFARQMQQFEQDVQPMVNAWKQTPIYKGYKKLPERAQRLIQTASEYAF